MKGFGVMTLGRIGFIALIVLGLPISVQAKTVRVTVEKLDYMPAVVDAKVGDTIEWVNKDALTHTATAKDGAWNVMLKPKKSGRLVLKKAGSVDYFCKFHPNMKGRVVVAP
jgi:plastocyanin